ncbi:MAG: GNAT family N-acetyltransferase [Thermoplasmatota archaeon]
MLPAVRRALAADIPLLVNHRQAMWNELGRPSHSFAADYEAWLTPRLLDDSLAAWIAAGEAGQASGCAWLQPIQPRPHMNRSHWCYLLSFYTEPGLRRQGAARSVLEAAIEWARTRDCLRVSLHASEAGRPLYAARGFRVAPEMWLDLEPPAS